MFPTLHIRSAHPVVKLYAILKQIENNADKKGKYQEISKLLGLAKKEFNLIKKDIMSHPEFNLK